MSKLRPIALVCTVALLAAGPAAAEFSWDIEHTGSVNDFFELESFHTVVTNTGATPDTVLVNMVKNAPAEWSATLCEDVLCYPPFILDIALELNPGASIELIIDITPITVSGQGEALITLTSSTNPAQMAQRTFTVVTPDLDLLVVDEAGNGAGALVGAAATAAGATHAVWDVAQMGKATATDMAAFPAVIWTAGPTAAGPDAVDRSALDAYVTAGGKLLLSGQDLLETWADPASPAFDPAARDWYRDTMGAVFAAGSGGTVAVSSAATDPLYGGAAYAINGGDGSADNASPDLMTARPGAAPSLTYDGGGTALVWTIVGGGKSALAGFGIEGIASAAERQDFVSRTLAWFAAGYAAADDTPAAGIAARAAPNPFNPQTTIRFAVPGDRAVPVAVTIHDVSGRTVRRLLDGTAAPGPGSVVWDGRDDAGRHLATGIYLARVRVDRQQDIVKLALVK